MKARRTFAGLVAAVCVVGGAMGAAQHQSSDVNSIGTSSTVVERSATSVGIEGCSSDCGLADEPTDTRVAAVLIPSITSVPKACGWAVDDLPDEGFAEEGEIVVSDALAKACDYRVTGQPCEEDEVCAVQVIRSTGDFTGTR